MIYDSEETCNIWAQERIGVTIHHDQIVVNQVWAKVIIVNCHRQQVLISYTEK